MTTYNLPKGMTAAEVAADIRYVVRNARVSWSPLTARLTSLADAIDPPEPVSIVTDEMVEAVLAEYLTTDPNDFTADVFVGRGYLEAAIECGWTPPGDPDNEAASDADNPSGNGEWPTDEQVLAAARALYASVKNPLPWESDKEWWIGRARIALEAVAPPPVNDDLAERLAMAERLLRRATGTTSIGVRYLALYELTAAEAEYLRSLTGEGDSDE